MRLLANWTVRDRNTERRIELLQGDLSRLPPEHAVDILVISAFPNDYAPTPSSLIGALHRAGISVDELSHSKQMDMREEFSCWLSKPVPSASAFRQLLCIESGWRGTPPEIVDDLFRALAPLFVTTFPGGSVAMPIIGAGDQGWPVDQMMESLLRSAFSWLQRGLSISVIKIVVFSEQTGEKAKAKFLQLQRTYSGTESAESHVLGVVGATKAYDVFISYSHQDFDHALAVTELVRQSMPHAHIFCDQRTIVPGQSWLLEIAESLDNARRVVALLTPHYWSSHYCKDEFTAALARQYDTRKPVLFPIHFRSTNIPYLFRNLQYEDCREEDSAKLARACSVLSHVLTQTSGDART